MTRVVFYSKNDLSSWSNLEKAESLIRSYTPNKIFRINDVIELYNIKLYFDNDLYLPSWIDEDKMSLINTVNQFWNTIAKFWLQIDDENVVELLNEVDFEFKSFFWQLVEKFDTYKKIHSSTFNMILNEKYFFIKDVLRHIKSVKHFSIELKDYFILNATSAEVLLSFFEQDHNLSEQQTLYFPKQLDDAVKESIILKYLESNDPNLNYVRLVVKSRNIKLSDKTKLKAKNLSNKLNDEIRTNGISWRQGVTIGISEDQIEPVKVEYKDNEQNYTYSQHYLLGKRDPVKIMQNFSTLFNYINHQGCIDLVSKLHQIDALEKVMMRSKNEYLISGVFHHRDLLSSAQFTIYKYLLNKNDLTLEQILYNIVNEFLNSNFSIKGLKITFPNKNSSMLEKIRMLVPEMESLMKQYKIFTEEGFIDFELLEFASTPLNLSQIQSNVTSNKYIYGDGMEFNRLRYCFFGSASMLYYVEPFKSKYKNFYSLITNEKIKYENFEHYQKTELDYLLTQNYLSLDSNNCIQIQNPDIIYVIAILHYEDVLSYWHYPIEIRNEIINLEKKGILKFDNSLFTYEERRYLNFFLNKKEFTNGLDLRNKYVHGSNSSSEKDQENDYNVLLKLLLLVVLKIEDDLYLSEIEIGSQSLI